jgi:hypothetical protein
MIEITNDEPPQIQAQTTTNSSSINGSSSTNLSALLANSSTSDESSSSYDQYRSLFTSLVHHIGELLCVDAWQWASDSLHHSCLALDHLGRSIAAFSFEARIFLLLLAVLALVNALSWLVWRLFAPNIRSYYANTLLFERIDEIRPNIIYCERQLSHTNSTAASTSTAPATATSSPPAHK